MTPSLDAIDYPVPTAMRQDADAVIFEISEPTRASREHLHLGIEPLRDPVGPGEAPHAHDGFNPRL